MWALRNFQKDQQRRARALNRGGISIVPFEGALAEGNYLTEVADHLTPERSFERQWAMTLLTSVMRRLAVWVRGWNFSMFCGIDYGEISGENRLMPLPPDWA